MAPDYSIIICSYNPDERLLSKCLDAVARLDRSGLCCEVILVDNNSTPPLSSRNDVQRSQILPELKIITEEQQGLTNARIAGIKHATGRYLVFFDDDNEPHNDYLQALTNVIQQYPQVDAWGPGDVSVDYIDGIEGKLKNYANAIFQERRDTHVSYACVRSWQPCYPYGTGLAISLKQAQRYVQLVGQQQLNLADRNGNQLTSGGDTQLVLCVIDTGRAAGVSPSLKINHLIPGKRSDFNYLKRLAYGSHACYDISIIQVFPEHTINFGRPVKSDPRMNNKIIRRYLKARATCNKVKMLKFIEYIGVLSSSYAALGRPAPKAINKVLKYLKIV